MKYRTSIGPANGILYRDNKSLLIFTKDNNVEVLNLENLEIIHKYSLDFGKFSMTLVNKNYLSYATKIDESSTQYSCLLINKDTFDIEKTIPDFIGTHLSRNIIAGSRSISETEVYTEIIDLDTLSTLLSKPYPQCNLLLLNDKYSIFQEGDKLYCYDNSNMNVVWASGLESILDDVQPYTLNFNHWFLIEDLLWIPLRNKPLIILDIKSGEVLQAIDNEYPNGNYGVYKYDPFINKVIKLFRDSYFEIDIATYELSYSKLEATKDHWTNTKNPFQIDENYIYFIEGRRTHLSRISKT